MFLQNFIKVTKCYKIDHIFLRDDNNMVIVVNVQNCCVVLLVYLLVSRAIYLFPALLVSRATGKTVKHSQKVQKTSQNRQKPPKNKNLQNCQKYFKTAKNH